MNAKWFRKFLSIPVLLVMIFSNVLSVSADGPNPPPNNHSHHRYIVVARSGSEYDEMRNDAHRVGAKVEEEMPNGNIMVVSADSDIQAQLEASPAVQSVAVDGVRRLIQPQMAQELGFNASPNFNRINMGHYGGNNHVIADPAFSLDGLMWNVNRINAPKAWKTTTGKSTVLVGVADTGLDYTHSELAPQVVHVEDLTDKTLCTDYFGMSDADWSTYVLDNYGVSVPSDIDWNGHGSWIGGNIAAALDGVGINGIAPDIKLVSLKISEWCGYAYDSSILDSFYYAANNGIDVVSISFGGYLDRSDPEQDTIYQAYVDAVAYARAKGTVIVAAAGNEHLRIGAGGQVISHGPLTLPGDPFDDYYGYWETPGGIPGVVMVSATGNVTNAASKNCDPSTIGSASNGEATCKPKSDTHQPIGAGKLNQLTYYSNYGPRVDVAAPGGSRKFNLPNADRGGTGGFPYVDTEGYKAWETFSITSNWALEIPCFYDLGPEFYPGECYSTIQGTSMATPHVSAVLALIASANRSARHNPDRLVRILKDSAQDIKGNTTPPLSATDLSAGDRTGLACDTGYCHLGGKAISDRDAYGAGLVDAYNSVR
jgi:subtilisin family serine protease